MADPTKPRSEHVSVLLNQVTAPADMARHHIRGTAHNLTLGFAAEQGVRDVLRQHLPRSLVVTSGFIRKSDETLLVPNQNQDLSRETDLIVYDSTRSCPLHSFDGIEVIAADDVLGVIEVKDSGNGEGALLPSSSDARGALRHIQDLQTFVPNAFRAIVLIQGEDPFEATKAVQAANLGEISAPHALYCRALGTYEKGVSYLGFHDFLENSFKVHAYAEDMGSPLVAFLRMVTGFMTARGLMTASLAPGLSPYPPDKSASPAPLALADREPIPSLCRRIREVFARSEKSFDGDLNDYVRTLRHPFVSVSPRSGLDKDGRPTVGLLLTVEYDGKEVGETESVGSLFVVLNNEKFASVDAPTDEPWIIEGESLNAYVRRVLSNISAVVFSRKPSADQKQRDARYVAKGD